LPRLILCFPPRLCSSLDSVCTFGVWDEGDPSGIRLIMDFGQKIVLVFLCSIFSAQVQSIATREQRMY